jgi:hypothetical protein
MRLNRRAAQPAGTAGWDHFGLYHYGLYQRNSPGQLPIPMLDDGFVSASGTFTEILSKLHLSARAGLKLLPQAMDIESAGLSRIISSSTPRTKGSGRNRFSC